MFKSIQKEVWAFDCEWVPDPHAGIVLHDLPPATPPQRVLEAMWAHGGATTEDPTPFLKTVLCRVVSIAAVRRRFVNNARKLDLLWLPRKPDDPGEQTEVSILAKFLGAVGKGKPQLVGFNSRSSDLKILVQRAVVNGLSVPDFCRRPDKPWEGCDYFARDNEWHIDMMEILGSWGGKSTVSLNEIARLSGIPGKFGTCGDDVAGLWLAGRWREIVEYNCFDALTTYLVWLRIAHFGGLFTPDQYAEEEQEVRDLIFELAAQPETAFLERYLEEWDRLQDLLPEK
jgi:hypothetical protein